LNNLAIILVVIIIAIIVGIIGNSDYQEITQARDQRNLQLSIDDCKKLFIEGIDRVDCFDKSIHVFGTEQQKQQWKSGYLNP